MAADEITFDEIEIHLMDTLKGDIVIIAQDKDTLETSPENMTKLCIQWLTLHNPSVLVEDK